MCLLSVSRELFYTLASISHSSPCVRFEVPAHKLFYFPSLSLSLLSLSSHLNSFEGRINGSTMIFFALLRGERSFSRESYSFGCEERAFPAPLHCILSSHTLHPSHRLYSIERTIDCNDLFLVRQRISPLKVSSAIECLEFIGNLTRV